MIKYRWNISVPALIWKDSNASLAWQALIALIVINSKSILSYLGHSSLSVRTLQLLSTMSHNAYCHQGRCSFQQLSLTINVRPLLAWIHWFPPGEGKQWMFSRGHVQSSSIDVVHIAIPSKLPLTNPGPFPRSRCKELDANTGRTSTEMLNWCARWLNIG